MNPEAYIEMAATEDRHWWFRGRRQIIASTLQRLGLPKPCRILEVGCGTGGNLDMLREFGTVFAFETDNTALELARRKSTCSDDIQPGRLPTENPFQEDAFDLICLFDVLEHLDDDRQSLAQLRTCLNAGGCLVMTVPAFSWLWSNHDTFLHHQRRYTRPELMAMLETLGFRVERSTYFNFWLFPLTAAMRIFNRVFGLASRAGTSVPPPAINECLFRVFASERHVLSHLNLPLGVSLLVVARTNQLPFQAKAPNGTH
jgi:SAM-dependent methyltransferase